MATESRPPTPALLVGLPTWLLSQANVRAHRLLSTALATHDARGHQVRVLAALDEFGPMSQVDLCASTDLDPGDATRTVSGLESVGFVDRRTDPNDRRRTLVSITSAGAARLRTLERVLADVQRDLLAPLDDTDQRALITILRKLQPH